jgi:hypothetical protein
MLHRLANVIYWLCCGLAALLAVFAVSDFVEATNGDQSKTIVTGFLAAVFFGVGRGVRYVLSGK